MQCPMATTMAAPILIQDGAVQIASVIEEYTISRYVCCKIIASNVQQTEPNDWQAI